MKRLAGLICAVVFTVSCGQTDTGITTDVMTRLSADDMVRAADVDVTTNNNVVTLTGEVESEAQRQQALMIARETTGVHDVVDQLRVRDTAATSGLLDPRDDPERDAGGIEFRGDLERDRTDDDLDRDSPATAPVP